MAWKAYVAVGFKAGPVVEIKASRKKMPRRLVVTIIWHCSFFVVSLLIATKFVWKGSP